MIGSSYVRFISQADYLVAYEGDCDPNSQSCFEDCEDEDCNEMYYYSIIEVQAAELSSVCGNNVTECDKAYACETSLSTCRITYCDPEIDGTETCVQFNDNSI